jgi:hypothetical protein
MKSFSADVDTDAADDDDVDDAEPLLPPSE